MFLLRFAVFGFFLFLTTQIFAQDEITCNEHHIVAERETLSSIAQRAYGAASMWQLLYHTNKDDIGDSPSLLQIGTALLIPCTDETVESVEASIAEPPTEDTSASESTGNTEPKIKTVIEVITASDYRPFTDAAWPGGGMITEIVQAAFAESPAKPDIKVAWIDAWSAHLQPLLSEHKFDMGFPWLKPDCSTPEARASLSESMRIRCEFLFSEPLFEMLVLFYGRNGVPEIRSASDLEGKTLCRPSGYYTFDLTEKGLIPGENITLEQPAAVKDCFRALMEGSVDFVTINEFTGRDTLKSMQLEDQVTAQEGFVSVQGLHLLIHRTHPRATVFLHYFNEGIKALQEDGELEKIVTKHLSLFYNEDATI